MKLLFIFLPACLAFGNTTVSAQRFPFIENSMTRVKPMLGGRDIEVRVVTASANGNYLAAGTIFPDRIIRYGDFWMACTDSIGRILWEKTLKAKGDDRLTLAIVTEEGGYLLAGSSTSPKGDDKTVEAFGMKDYWLVKLSRTGEVEWQQSAGGSRDDLVTTLIPTGNGYSVGGQSQSEDIGNPELKPGAGGKTFGMFFYGFWIVEIAKDGRLLSHRDLSQDFSLLNTYHLRDGGYLLQLESKNMPDISRQVRLVKLDSAGRILWEKDCSALPHPITHLSAFAETENGDFYFGGNITRDEYNEDYTVMGFTANGEMKWHRSYGGDDLESFYYMHPSGNGLLLSGTSKSDVSGQKTEASPGNGFTDLWVLCIDENGNIVWQMTAGGYDNEQAGQVTGLKDGSCIIAGSSLSDISGNKSENSFGGYDYWVLKRSAAGSVEWQKTFGGNQQDLLEWVQPTPDGGFLLAGWSESGRSGNKTTAEAGVWLVKLDAAGNAVWQKGYAGEFLELVAQNDRGEIYIIFTPLMDGAYVRKLSANGTLLEDMVISDKLFLYCLPVRIYDNQQMVIGENEIFVGRFTQNYPDHANPRLVCDILDECFKHVRRQRVSEKAR